MITCHDVHKHFGGFHAVDGVSLEIPAGAITGLIGPNGAGKSTLFNVIAGLYRPTSGTVTMAGEDITGLPPHELFAKGLLRTFQIAREFSSMSVLENLMMAPVLLKRSNKNQAREHAVALLERVGMGHKADAYPGQLSGGQQQRVAIARAIVRQPKILIADEPTGNLDPKNTWEIVRLLEKINKYGTTVLLTTHNAEIVNKLKRRVITIEEGKITADQAEGSYRQ